jgi:hypothetical protein
MKRRSIIATVVGFVLAGLFYALADVLRRPWRKP